MTSAGTEGSCGSCCPGGHREGSALALVVVDFGLITPLHVVVLVSKVPGGVVVLVGDQLREVVDVGDTHDQLRRLVSWDSWSFLRHRQVSFQGHWVHYYQPCVVAGDVDQDTLISLDQSLAEVADAAGDGRYEDAADGEQHSCIDAAFGVASDAAAGVVVADVVVAYFVRIANPPNESVAVDRRNSYYYSHYYCFHYYYYLYY